MFKAPLIWFPSISLLIDDDALFTRLLIANLGLSETRYIENPKILLEKKEGDFIFYGDDGKINFLTKEHLKENYLNVSKEKTLISVIISDLNMPEISGTELFDKIEDIYTTRVLMSGFIENELKKNKQGNIDFIIDKGENFTAELLSVIKKAQVKFFINFSNFIFKEKFPSHPLMENNLAKNFLSEIERFNPDEIIPSKDLMKFTFKNFKNNTDKIIEI